MAFRVHAFVLCSINQHFQSLHQHTLSNQQTNNINNYDPFNSSLSWVHVLYLSTCSSTRSLLYLPNLHIGNLILFLLRLLVFAFLVVLLSGHFLVISVYRTSLAPFLHIMYIITHHTPALAKWLLCTLWIQVYPNHPALLLFFLTVTLICTHSLLATVFSGVVDFD